MKKFICILLCIIITFSFSSCMSTNTTAPQTQAVTRITLTEDNYDEYLNINTYVTDYSLIVSETPGEYYVSMVFHIETSKKIECSFENVSITYNSPVTLGDLSKTRGIPMPTTIDIDGNSHTSDIFITSTSKSYRNASYVAPPYFSKSPIKSIKGTVIVPIEE